MANYSIQRSEAAAGDVTVNEAATNTTTNVTLIGQNFTGYGDEIATNFLQMLENYSSATAPEANPRVPGSAAIPGQLWYDLGNSTLKVYDVSWKEMSPINKGSVESAALRWNDTAGRWQEEERVRISDAGSFIIDAASAGTNAVTFNHDGTNLGVVGAGTVDITVSGITGDFTVIGGRGLSVESGAGALAVRHDGTDVNWTNASTTDWNISGLTAINLNGGIYFDIAEMADPGFGVDATRGRMWVRNDAPNVLVFTDDAGTDWDLNVAGSAVVNMDDLADVTTANTNNAILHVSGGNFVEASGLTYNGTTLNATQYNNILAANLIDRSAPGTLAATIFSGNITSQANILLGDSDQVVFGAGSDVTAAFDGTDFIVSGPGGTADFQINSFGGNVLIDGSQIFIDNLEGEVIRLQGNTTANSLDVYIGFRDSANTVVGRIGITSTSTNALRIDGSADGVELIGSDANVKLDLGGIGTALRGYNASNETSFITSVVGTSLATTRLQVDTDIDSPSVGFNETPVVTGGAGLGAAGTYVTSIDDVGRFLTRTTSSNSTVEIDQMVSAPIGATFLIHNDNGGGTMTISEGTSVTLEWIDGSDSAPPTGNRTLAYNSICTIRKKNTTDWQIWGNGIS